MATYKVIQDIEAEDHFVGPLTLKQFIFVCVGILFGYLNIFALSRGAPILIGMFLPPMLLSFFLAIPWSKDQPTEIWVLARLRFLTKPKKRLWNQTGIQELVTVTAPKKQEENLTKNFTQTEVKSRLKALAETIDSRGWAVKHASVDEGAYNPNDDLVSDRLISASSLMPDQVPEFDVDAVPDVLDTSSNPLSGNLSSMIQSKDDERKQDLLQKMDKARRGEALGSQSSTQPNISTGQPVTQQASTKKSQQKNVDEQLLASQLRAQKEASSLAHKHMRGISTDDTELQNTSQPQQATAQTDGTRDDAAGNSTETTGQKTASTDKSTSDKPMTPAPSPDTIRLANNNDLNLSTLAREAERKGESKEVVISLH